MTPGSGVIRAERRSLARLRHDRKEIVVIARGEYQRRCFRRLAPSIAEVLDRDSVAMLFQ
jgi:hypothetical protein